MNNNNSNTNNNNNSNSNNNNNNNNNNSVTKKKSKKLNNTKVNPHIYEEVLRRRDHLIDSPTPELFYTRVEGVIQIVNFVGIQELIDSIPKTFEEAQRIRLNNNSLGRLNNTHTIVISDLYQISEDEEENVL
ncbi:expressed protein [Dictyostelium purpureum]|uniref:Expressed protein n=1 Tax=Dictyostelium purpureum TaxID=5786 RepID=F0ZZL9_DICPU|nr:uncharacterized protein DICPUDRAFT_99486 [Dictyostelium purpureum]EGC30618.1 expressed protein [Dictyostelium purpureum]|eukprot:XP_003292853.1 expressed protein [Dictyostelium purpureum]